jgi:hypothetical protein
MSAAVKPSGDGAAGAAAPTVVLYRYGMFVGVWRLLAVAGLLGAGVMLWLAWTFGSPWYVCASVVLAAPAVWFPWIVADVVELADDTLVVTNLFYLRRRIALEDLGPARVKQRAQSLLNFRAPRVWVGVRGRPPIYLDLWADIPDPNRLRRTFGIGRLPRGVGPRQ